MIIENGQFVSDSVDDILEALLVDAKEYFGEDLNDEQLAVIRLFYAPIAKRLAEAQKHIGLVLSSAQIEYAEGTALDLLTSLIGVRRREARRARGEATFSRQNTASVDYTIPQGTIIQTDELSPVRFETRQTAVLEAGETEVTIPVRAQRGGVHGNVGANSLTVMPSPPIGIEKVTNAETTDGGREEETDTELRDRAKQDLAEGSAATAPALVTAVRSVPDVHSVSIFVNDSDDPEPDGLPEHSFELVVEGGEDNNIGQMILDKKGAGDTSWGGVYGELVEVDGELPNGQTLPVMFSRPLLVPIYVSVEVETTDEYAGDDALRDSIVSYIGGTTSYGNAAAGRLGVGDDVLYGKVMTAVYNVRGVHDVLDLRVDIESPATGVSNISVDFNERPTIDADEYSIEIDRSEL